MKKLFLILLFVLASGRLAANSGGDIFSYFTEFSFKDVRPLIEFQISPTTPIHTLASIQYSVDIGLNYKNTELAVFFMQRAGQSLVGDIYGGAGAEFSYIFNFASSGGADFNLDAGVGYALYSNGTAYDNTQQAVSYFAGVSAYFRDKLILGFKYHNIKGTGLSLGWLF